jgi:CubicO group peptidase (beta-lactamase class C family)
LWDFSSDISALNAQPPLQHRPGTTHSYANMNYVVLGHIVEKVTGDRLDLVVRDRIFRSPRPEAFELRGGRANRPCMARDSGGRRVGQRRYGDRLDLLRSGEVLSCTSRRRTARRGPAGGDDEDDRDRHGVPRRPWSLPR